MFIVIYKNGNQYYKSLEKETFAQVYALPGDKYIFWWNENTMKIDLYKEGGVLFYEDSSEERKCEFTHKNYTLTHIYNCYSHQTKIHNYEFVFRYNGFYDKIVVSENYTNLTITKSFPQELSNAIKEIICASEFPTHEDYEENKNMKQDFEDLNKEIANLKNELSELKSK